MLRSIRSVKWTAAYISVVGGILYDLWLNGFREGDGAILEKKKSQLRLCSKIDWQR